MHFLLYSAILLSTALQVECYTKLDKLPDIITCRPEDEGTVIVHQESAWRVCENGKLVQKACILAWKPEYLCITHEKTFKKSLTYLEGPLHDRVEPIFVGKDEKMVDCVGLWELFSIFMPLFLHKKDNYYTCSDGMKKTPREGAHELCTVDKPVVFMSKDSVYECNKAGQRMLTKCVIQKGDKYMCLSIEQIEHAVRNNGFWAEVERRVEVLKGNFCLDLSSYIEQLYPKYQEDWEYCHLPSKEAEPYRSVSDENKKTIDVTEAPKPTTTIAPVIPTEAPTQPTEVVRDGKPTRWSFQVDLDAFRTDLTPNYIDCKNPNNKNALIIDRDSYFRECTTNGTLEATHCAFNAQHNKSIYWCETYQRVVVKMRDYFSDPDLFKIVYNFYLDKGIFNYADCYTLSLDIENSLFYMGLFSTKFDCFNYSKEIDYNAKDKWCRIKNRDIYTLDTNGGWYTCKDGAYELKKCLLKIKGEYKCISVKKIEEALAHNPEVLEQMKAGNFCENFFETASELYPTYMFNLEPCEDAAVQLNVPPMIPQANAIPAPQPAPTPAPPAAAIAPNAATQTDETAPETDTTDSPVEKSDEDSFYVVPFEGTLESFSAVDGCPEDPVTIDGIVYVCGIPSMCTNEAGQCLSFFDVKNAFENYHNKWEAWDDDQFVEIRDNVLDYEDSTQLYSTLENSQYGDTDLFDTLVRVMELEEGESPEDEKTVTIPIGDIQLTTVTPKGVCKVFTKYAPFSKKFISKHFQDCP